MKRGAIAGGVCALVLLVLPASAGALVFNVDTFDDSDDGACVPDPGDCTLREAIDDANLGNAKDFIQFTMSGTITPATPLPQIIWPLDIDGTTAPGASPGTPTVEIDGSTAGGDGFNIGGGASDVTIRSLAITNFSGAGIRFHQSTTQNMVVGSYIGLDLNGFTPQPNGTGVVLVDAFNTFIGNAGVSGLNVISGNSGGGGIQVGTNTNGIAIRGNYIGTNAAGSAAVPNGGPGITQSGIAGSLSIGGDFAGAGNVISGNAGAGIEVIGTGVVTIEGNRIGTNAAGTAAVPNIGPAGVHLSASAVGVDIGGAAPASRNVISGNINDGVLIDGVSNNNVNGNLIGTNAGNTGALGNGGSGVALVGGTANELGNLASNIIAFNAGQAGITATGAGTNQLSGSNNVHSNAGLAIDLEADGVTPNDGAPDADAGTNGLVNFPTVTAATITPTATTITATLDAAPNTLYEATFFLNSACDPSGNGEAQLYLGSKPLTTSAAGNATVTFTRTVALPAGMNEVTATTTTASDRSTSELSSCFTAARLPDPPPAPVPSNGDTVVAAPEAGVVKVKVPGSNRYVLLRAGDDIPVGSHVDATKGRVQLTSVSPQRVRQTADFYAGAFRVKQADGATVVDLVLEGGRSPRQCPQRADRGKRRAFGPRRVLRKLWGSGRGRFRTRGRGGAGTVRGTKWLTADRCDGTLFKVREGVVAVRDFDRRKTVEVRAGGRYLARLR